jgi:hypothetical protein
VRLFGGKRGVPAADEAAQQPPQRRRRRAPRADGPRTIVPLVDEAEGRPSWLPDDAPVASSSPFELKLDAARERLRLEIPPPINDE